MLVKYLLGDNGDKTGDGEIKGDMVDSIVLFSFLIRVGCDDMNKCYAYLNDASPM